MSFLLASLSLAGPAPAPVPSPPSLGFLAYINEIRIDQPGADNDEYLEIYTPGGPMLLDLLSYIVIGDGAGGSGTIEAVIDLSAYTTNADGYLVVAEPSFSLGTADVTATLDFENGDNVTHLLVWNFTGAVGDDLDTDDDGLLDSTPWFGLFDGVGLIETETPDLGAGEEYAYATELGLPNVGPDGAFVPGHVKLCSPASGGMNLGSFATGIDDTPGAPSIACPPPTSTFCSPPEPNSFSAGGGLMSSVGSFSLETNDNVLIASNLPNTFGVFIQAESTMPAAATAIGGNLCLAGSIHRMNEIVAISSNQAVLTLDFDDPTRVEDSTFVGEPYYYQFFYRDTTFPGGGNYTDALEVSWED